MRIRKLNFNKAKLFDTNDPGILIFIKPLGSKLHRVAPVSNNKELIQVLNTLCVRKHNKLWYFNFCEIEAQEDTLTIFALMGFAPMLVSLDAAPSFSN